MKRWQASEFGVPNTVLEKVEVPLPEPGPDEARVRVLAASVALPDLMMVQGRYPLVPSAPVSPGQEIVGIVDKPGAGYPFSTGARIMGNSRADIAIGGLAEYTLSPALGAMPAPAELTDAQAAGFPGSYHVAHIGLVHRAALRKGETLLVVGGSGRTGSAAIQLGKALGATVIATARNEDKARFCRLQGADHWGRRPESLASSPTASTTWTIPEMVRAPRWPIHSGPGWRPRMTSQAEMRARAVGGIGTVRTWSPLPCKRT